MKARTVPFGVAKLALISGSLMLSACSSESKPEAAKPEAPKPEAYAPQGDVTRASAFQAGVPGGVIIDTATMTAKVSAVDPATRKVTLVEPSGKQTVITCGPEVINFDQIHVGDELKATVESKLVVFMKTPGAPSTDGRITAIAGAAKGDTPAAAGMDTVQVTATVSSVDQKARRATLRFPDGRSTTVPIRPDVDLTKVSKGDQVVIRKTDAVAVVVEAP
jgi:hypothetical protein